MKIELTSDENKKLITADGDPLILFEERPLMMLRAIKLVSGSGFDLQGAVYKAILEKESLLSKVDVNGIRAEFEEIIIAEHAGKGLKMLVGTGLIKHIIGELAENMSKGESEQFTGLTENIDVTKRIRERRLGLVYICFGKDNAFDAIEILNFDMKTERLLKFAVRYIEKINFLATTYEFKQFIARHGMERYEFIHNLSKSRRMVYDLDDAKIKSRHYILEYIEDNNEPIFIEDMNITRDDLLMHNITSEEKVDELLMTLLDVVHRNPRLNTKKALLANAEEYAKNSLQSILRKVRLFR